MASWVQTIAHSDMPGASFDGTATLSAVASTLDAITLSTLPSTFQISIGDLVAITYASGRQTLHRAQETATASAGVASFAVEPVLFPGGPVGTAGAVTLARAVASPDFADQIAR